MTLFQDYNHRVPSLNQELESKSEDSGYENGDSNHSGENKIESGASQNIMSSSSSSCSPTPKSSTSGSRVSSAFSDSPLESEEPISLGTDLPSSQTDVVSHSNGNITNLEMEGSESRCTMNEMERVISDLKTENLRLRLDLGVKIDNDSGSVDESLRSVDEEVQEVTAVRLVFKSLAYYIFTISFPLILNHLT